MAMSNLLDHPFWRSSDPSAMRLVRMSTYFPPALNPFHDKGVTISAAGVPGDVRHSKWYVAREGILDGLKLGRITPDTHIVEASSGNTGDGLAGICNTLGLEITLILPGDTPGPKINAIRALGRYVNVETHSKAGQSATERARELGAQLGWYSPDQYAGEWNPNAHFKYLAPQLFDLQIPSLLFLPAGTMGTAMGLHRYSCEHKLETRIIPVVCAEGEEVPGARSLSRIERDVRLPWRGCFERLWSGPRHESFLLSYLSWTHMPEQMLGPSFGLGYYGALSFLQCCVEESTLDGYRDANGRIHVVLFGPDDNRLYSDVYFSELTLEELSDRTPSLVRLRNRLKLTH